MFPEIQPFVLFAVLFAIYLFKFTCVHIHQDATDRLDLKDIGNCRMPSMRHIIVRGRRQWAYCRDPHIFICPRLR